MTESPTDWQVFARWSLGELSDEEYIEHLLARGESEDEPMIQTLRRHAERKREAEGR